MCRRRSDFPLWIGPSTRFVRPRGTDTLTSCSMGAPTGPVRPRISSAGVVGSAAVCGRAASTSDHQSGDEVEDRVDERVGAEDADHAINDRTRRRGTDRRDVALDAEPLVGGDDADDDGEDERLGEPDDDVAHTERRLELLDEDPRAEAEEAGGPDPPTEGDHRVG